MEKRKTCYGDTQEGIPNLLGWGGVKVGAVKKGFLEEVILVLNPEGWLEVFGREREPCELRNE